MKVGIFGGSFNPVTKAHTRLANYIVEHNVVDVVLMMPCYKSLYLKGLVDGGKRLDMIALSSHHPKVKPYDWEIKNKIDGPGTYQIMQMIHDEFILDELYFITGLDNSQKVRTWKNGDKIIESMNFIIVPRCDVEVKDKWFLQPPHIYLDNYEPDDLSSSKFKQLYKDNLDTSSLIDKHVKDYIIRYNLYKDTP